MSLSALDRLFVQNTIHPFLPASDLSRLARTCHTQLQIAITNEQAWKRVAEGRGIQVLGPQSAHRQLVEHDFRRQLQIHRDRGERVAINLLFRSNQAGELLICLPLLYFFCRFGSRVFQSASDNFLYDVEHHLNRHLYDLGVTDLREYHEARDWLSHATWSEVFSLFRRDHINGREFDTTAFWVFLDGNLWASMLQVGVWCRVHTSRAVKLGLCALSGAYGAHLYTTDYPIVGACIITHASISACVYAIKPERIQACVARGISGMTSLPLRASRNQTCIRLRNTATTVMDLVNRINPLSGRFLPYGYIMDRVSNYALPAFGVR